MNLIIQKLKSKHTSLKKYTNWTKIIYFISFWGNERIKQPNIWHHSVECGICYVYKLGDSVPTEVCDNEKCGQPFHAECLYEHLSTSHGATKSHNTIFGKCPFCETDIICQFQLSK